jgi:hypothetical protein
MAVNTIAPIDLAPLLSQAVAGGTPVSALTPEIVLNLPSTEVSRLRAAAAAALDEGMLPRDLISLWRDQEKTLDSEGHTHLLCAQPPPQRALRRAVLHQIAQIAEARGLRIVLEELAANTDSEYSQRLREAGFFHLRVANLRVDSASSYRESVRLRAHAMTTTTPLVENARTISLDDVLVAEIDEDGRGARLWLHPFLGVRSQLTSSGAPWRNDVFAAIIDAALVAAEEHGLVREHTPSASAGDESALRDAVTTLDLLPGFVRAVGIDPLTQRREIEGQLTESTSNITRLRNQLMEAIRAQTALQARAQTLTAEAEALSVENIALALTQINRIRTRLRAVREITLVTGAGQPTISVTLHPLVMSYRRRRYLLDQLAFTIPLASDQHAQPRWLKTTLHHGSPHPHVSSNGGTCWGQADAPLHQALRNKDFVAAVMLIVGWAGIYNPTSPYTPLNDGHSFEVCDLAPGWHPELPVREP